MRGAALVVGASALLALALPAGASAASHSVCAGGCDFTSIQAAVDSAGTSVGDTIDVGPGVYSEQVTLDKRVAVRGAGQSTIVRSPASPSIKFPGGDEAPVFYVPASGSGSGIGNLAIDGQLQGGPGYSIVGVGFRNASGGISGVKVSGTRSEPSTLAESGKGVIVLGTDAAAHSVTIANSQISDFGLRGIDVRGTGVSATVNGTYVTGTGTDAAAAPQTGVAYSGGATGEVNSSTISEAADAGIVSDAGPGVRVIRDLIQNSGDGVRAVYRDGLPDSRPVVERNAFADDDIGVHVVRVPGSVAAVRLDSAANRFDRMGTAAIANETPGVVTAENSWFGCNQGPANPACAAVTNSGGGSVDFDPWLTFGVGARDGVFGEQIVVVAGFLVNSDDQCTGSVDFRTGLCASAPDWPGPQHTITLTTNFGRVSSPGPGFAVIANLVASEPGTATITAVGEGITATTQSIISPATVVPGETPSPACERATKALASAKSDLDKARAKLKRANGADAKRKAKRAVARAKTKVANRQNTVGSRC